MNSYIKSVRQSIQDKNWYSALALSLTLPDICAILEYPNLKKKSQKRYIDWFNKYVIDNYTGFLGPNRDKHIFLSGNDCYALRCAFLHQGQDSITDQRARETLNRFTFVKPPTSGSIHCNQNNTVLQLQVDIFCEDICAGVEKWVDEMNIYKPHVIENFNSLLKIKEPFYF